MDFKYFIEQSTDFFKDAQEYIDLRRLFMGIMPWIDMIVGPLVTIIYGSYDIFSVMSWVKAFQVFRQLIRYFQLSAQIKEWRRRVKDANGPFISTNDPEYHVFVYADGMQRLHNSHFRTTCPALRQNR